MSFLLLREEVHRLKDRVTVIHRRRCAYHVAIRASRQVGSFLTDILCRVRSDRAFLEVVQDYRAILQLVRSSVRFALSLGQLIFRRRHVLAHGLHSRFDCGLAVCLGGSFLSGFVHLTAEAGAYVKRRLVRTSQFIEVYRRFFVLRLLLRIVLNVQVMVANATVIIQASIIVMTTASTTVSVAIIIVAM